jgi:hypothetical protein
LQLKASAALYCKELVKVSDVLPLVLAAGTAVRLAAGPAAGRLADRLDASRSSPRWQRLLTLPYAPLDQLDRVLSLLRAGWLKRAGLSLRV